MSEWISVEDRLPKEGEIVLAVVRGAIRIASIFTEHPSFEETYQPYDYWDDPYDDGQIWEWFDVTHWMPLPEPPRSE